MTQQISSPYEISLHQLQQSLKHYDWSDISKSYLSSIPQSQLFPFTPSQDHQQYYQSFRYILNTEEKSQRANCLMKLLLKIKTSNYYALMVHRQYFLAKEYQQNDILQQIRFINGLLDDNAKEYHLWAFKKQILLKHQVQTSKSSSIYESQTMFLEYLLNEDSKNYHVWDYKFWMTNFFEKNQEELQWTEKALFKKHQSNIYKMLTQKQTEIGDFTIQVQEANWRNCYSCWSYRFNLLKNSMSINQANKQKFQVQEYQKTLSLLKQTQNHQNQCIWNYFTGIILEYKCISIQEKMKSYNMFNYQFKSSQNRFMGNFCLQINDFLKQNVPNEQRQKLEKQKTEIIEQLMKVDNVRALYYQYLLY